MLIKNHQKSITSSNTCPQRSPKPIPQVEGSPANMVLLYLGPPRAHTLSIRTLMEPASIWWHYVGSRCPKPIIIPHKPSAPFKVMYTYIYIYIYIYMYTHTYMYVGLKETLKGYVIPLRVNTGLKLPSPRRRSRYNCRSRCMHKTITDMTSATNSKRRCKWDKSDICII